MINIFDTKSHYNPFEDKRILVVDDDPCITQIFQLFLESAGFMVETLNNPHKLIKSFTPGYYDLILLDIRMPRMNGFILFQKLKLIDPTIKVCFITGFEAYFISLKEQFSLDVNCFIKKPISQYDLVRHVKKQFKNEII